MLVEGINQNLPLFLDIVGTNLASKKSTKMRNPVKWLGTSMGPVSPLAHPLGGSRSLPLDVDHWLCKLVMTRICTSSIEMETEGQRDEMMVSMRRLISFMSQLDYHVCSCGRCPITSGRIPIISMALCKLQQLSTSPRVMAHSRQEVPALCVAFLECCQVNFKNNV